MKVKYYKNDDIMVISLAKRPIDHAEENNWVIVHYDKLDDPVRIEILDASRFLKEESRALPEEVKRVYFA